MADTRRRELAWLAKVKSAVTILLTFMATVSAMAEDQRPNILWIFSDDHAVQAFDIYESRLNGENLTPNLDRLASEGMVFDRAYVGNSICGPSRATLLTGKHSHKHGKIDNRSPFDHSQPQFQNIMREQGYQTSLIGKIHIDGAMQGFDHWEVLPGQGRYINPEFISESGRTVHRGHSTDVITDRALRWIEEDRDPNRPFMLMVHYKAPHRNWTPADRFREAFSNRFFPEPDTLFDNYEGRGTAAREQDLSIKKTMLLKNDLKVGQWPERTAWFEEEAPEGDDLVRWKYQAYMRDYLACIAGIDENVGRLLEDLKARGLDSNTVVMYSSDQGFYLGEHGWFDKRFMYEESFRTPLIARWPGKIQPGSRNADLVQNIDNAPTFLDLAGVPVPADMHGQSMVPLLKGETPDDWRKSLYYHYYEFPHGNCSVRRHEGVATDRYKLIRFYGPGVHRGEEWELYDLKSDPQEMRSCYHDPEMADQIERLKGELRKLRNQYEVPSDDAFAQQPGQPARRPPVGKVSEHLPPLLRDTENKSGRLDLGGRLRLRYEWFNHYNLKTYGTSVSDDVPGSKLWLDARYRIGDDFAAFVRLQDARFQSGEFEVDDFTTAKLPMSPHQDPLDLAEANLEFRKVGGSPVGLKAGRQMIHYRDQRIWGQGDWNNSGTYTWDAVKLSWQSPVSDVDGIYGRRVIKDPNRINRDHFDFDAWGIYAMVKVLPFDLDVFYILKTDAQPVTSGESGTNALALNAVGGYVNWKSASGVKLGGTLVGQFGDWGDDRVDAWGGVASAGYVAADVSGEPGVSFVYTYASGDRNPEDGRHETLDVLFGPSAAYYGRMNMMAWMNMHNYQADLICKVSDWDLKWSYHVFRLDEAKDAWYFSNGRPVRRDLSGESGKDIGQEVDFVVHKKISEKLSLDAAYCRFFAGDYAAATGSGKDADWLYVQMNMSF